jgi:kinesin family member 3B
MQGVPSDQDLQGIIPRTFSRIFDHINKTSDRKFLTHVSFYEIYNEEVRDLLAPVGKQKESLEVKEKADSGFYVKDLSTINVKNDQEMMKLLESGNRNRSVGATLMNEQSSRSHSVFTINIESCETSNNDAAEGEKSHIIAGKLCLVDLAGSERQTKTGASGTRLKEAAKINLSLSALGNCISALVDGKSSHIPYRDSKLTKLLQDSLGGNAKTSMIATISPVVYNLEETLSTLRYANRAKNIKNKPKINQDPKDALLKDYQNEIERLKALLFQKRAGTANKTKSGSPASNSAVLTKRVSASELEVQKKLAETVISEKDNISKELNSKQAELEKEKKSKEELVAKLAELESQLVGGDDIVKHVDIKKAEVNVQKAKLESQKQAAMALQQKVGANESVQSQLEEKYASLQEEVDIKTKKLKKLWAKLDDIKQEKVKIQDSFGRDRQELQDTIHELTKELGLKDKIIENFISVDVKEDLEKRAVFSDELGEWSLKPRVRDPHDVFRPKASSNPRDPILSLSTRYHLTDPKSLLRYKPFNIIPCEPEFPK